MKTLAVPYLSLAARHPVIFHGPEDRAEFFTYPPEEQESVRALWDAMMRIAAAKNPHQGAREAAQPGRDGWSAKYLRTIFDEWQAAGRDWRYLIDKRAFPDAREPALPPDFQAFIRAKFSSNQRKNAPAWRQIIRQWERWLETGDARCAIPGYVDAGGFPTCPPPGPRGRHPRGWSEKNLNRYAPPPAELVMARIGVAAAKALLPQIPGTREGARFLEWVSGDDVWLDRKCMVVGFGPQRLLQFGMMDYAASYYLTFIQRPEIPRKDGSMEQLKRRDFLWTVALMLEQYGYPLDYVMHIVCERGTATMSRAEARFLYEVSEGQIVVGWSSMEGELVHAWDERKSGNSRAKGWHESFHNLFHNEHGDTAGQVGKDRDHSPAALQGRERHALALNNAAMICTPEQRAQFRFPFPSPQEAYLDTLDRVALINDRKEHDCEGFSSVMEWRPAGLRIRPLAEAELLNWLAQHPRADLDRDVEWFPRPESPRERMLRLSAGRAFQRLPGSVWRRFYEDCHEIKKISADGSFEFRKDGRTFRFVPPTPDQALPVGLEVSGFYRPDGGAIHLFSGGDRYLLTWPKEKRTRRDDAAAKQIAFARKQSFFNVALGNVREATSDEVERAQADALHNERILAESGLLPEGVQDGCTRAAAAVLEVAAQDESAAAAVAAVKRIDLVKETLKQAPRPAGPREEDRWL